MGKDKKKKDRSKSKKSKSKKGKKDKKSKKDKNGDKSECTHTLIFYITLQQYHIFKPAILSLFLEICKFRASNNLNIRLAFTTKLF